MGKGSAHLGAGVCGDFLLIRAGVSPTQSSTCNSLSKAKHASPPFLPWGWLGNTHILKTTSGIFHLSPEWKLKWPQC